MKKFIIITEICFLIAPVIISHYINQNLIDKKVSVDTGVYTGLAQAAQAITRYL